MALSPPPPPATPPLTPVTGPGGYADDEPLHRSSPPPLAAGRDRAELGSEEQYEMAEQFELASRGARLGARIIDVLIVAFIVLLILVNFALILNVAGLVDFEDSETPEGSEVADFELGNFIILMLVVTGIWCVYGVYEVVLTAVKGQTLGKMIVKIKVVRADSGSVPEGKQSVIRWIIPTATIVLLPVGGFFISLLVYISLLWGSDRQGWHDKAAKTLVIKASPSNELPLLLSGTTRSPGH